MSLTSRCLKQSSYQPGLPDIRAVSSLPLPWVSFRGEERGTTGQGRKGERWSRSPNLRPQDKVCSRGTKWLHSGNCDPAKYHIHLEEEVFVPVSRMIPVGKQTHTIKKHNSANPLPTGQYRKTKSGALSGKSLGCPGFPASTNLYPPAPHLSQGWKT